MSLQPVTHTEDFSDSLFAATGVKSIPADGYVLADDVTGVVQRGQALKHNIAVDEEGATSIANPRELIPVTDATDQVVAILAETVNTAETKAIAVYEEGEFNRYKVIFADDLTYADFEVAARMKGIYFKDVVQWVD